MQPHIQMVKKARPQYLRICFLTITLLGAVQTATAQPESFGGNPDSNRFIRIPDDTDDWTRHFRIGAQVGLNINASFNDSGSFNISGHNAANGMYDDGYVKPDQTGDPHYTSNWGYNNASQYNAANNTLALHSSTAFSTSSSANADGGAFPGFEMAYGGNLWYWKHARIGWELEVGLLPIDIKENSTSPGTINQNTYIFDTGGIVLPTAPYQGGPGGVGPLLTNSPSSFSSATATGTIDSSRKLDAMLYTVRFGPSLYWDLTEHVSVSLGAGPALGIVSGDYKYNETINIGGTRSQNSGKVEATDVTFGGYVSSALMVHVQESADIFVAVQYMPMGDATFSGGGREAKLKLGGQLYFSAGVNWPF
jgi:hypothetical protein